MHRHDAAVVHRRGQSWHLLEGEKDQAELDQAGIGREVARGVQTYGTGTPGVRTYGRCEARIPRMRGARMYGVQMQEAQVHATGTGMHQHQEAKVEGLEEDVPDNHHERDSGSCIPRLCILVR